MASGGRVDVSSVGEEVREGKGVGEFARIGERRDEESGRFDRGGGGVVGEVERRRIGGR